MSPFEPFCCYWMAFNNIYHFVAWDAGVRAKVKKKKGVDKLVDMGGTKILDIQPAGERKQIKEAIKALAEPLKDALLRHESTAFFINRHPYWHGAEREFDDDNRPMNGVLNVTHSEAAGRPVWSPINHAFYTRYLTGNATADERNNLIETLVFVLYAVRNIRSTAVRTLTTPTTAR